VAVDLYGQPGTTANVSQGAPGRVTTQPVAQQAQQQVPVAGTSPTSGTTNSLQPSYIPTPPQAQATTYAPATTGATGYNAATYQDPYTSTQATNELTQAAGVQDQSQNSQLMSMLAAQGISPGSSAAQAALQNLAGAQGAALDPSLASAQENAAGLQSTAGLSNQSALNSAGQYNAGASNTAALANQSALNTGGQYNASAMNTDTQQNLQDLLQTQEYNSGAYNAAGQDQASLQNNDYLAQLQAQLGLQTTGLQGSNSLAGQQANQTVPLDPSLFSQISSGVEGAANTAAQFLPA
jgi:hypothetical protein